MEYTNTITVIDFETATSAADSICAVGLVVLKDGFIADGKHFYVQPPNNKYQSANIKIHGITPEITAKADPFPDVWEKIKPYFYCSYVAAHNASFDMSILKTTLSSYGIEQPHFMYFDTLHLLDDYLEYGEKRTLDALCNKFNIPLELHHNALYDATATAKLILYHYNIERYDSFNSYFNSLYLQNFGNVTVRKAISFGKSTKTIVPFTKHQSAKSVTTSTIVSDERDADFDGKTFLFTGDMESMSREDAMHEVVKRGGIIKDGISQKIDVLVNANSEGVVTGKIKRALEIQAAGHHIKIVNEQIFLKMLADNDAVDLTGA